VRKRVQIHHHEVDVLDAMCLGLLVVLRVAAHGEDASVDQRVQCLDATAEDLWKARVLRDFRH
jgi:hypothetical protein